jgi:hypothetical protein
MELHSPLTHSTLIYCDNVSVVYLASNPVQHQRTKHVEIDFHLVHDKVTIREVCVSARPDDFSVHQHLHQGPTLSTLLLVSL